MPDLYNNNQITTLHLDNNQIQLINRNYSTIEYLYLTSNHIYALHLTNLSYPKLKLLDLSHNPIEHIIENFFSNQQFPQLKILQLTNALKHINPYLIDNRLISFSSLTYLNEIYLNENNFEEFSCSKNLSFIQWKFSSNIKTISLGKNQLKSLDENCFSQIFNLTELDLSTNQFNFNDIKINPFPPTLKSLYLNSITSNLSCVLFENLIELEQLHLADLKATQLENCMFKNLLKLKIVSE
jgi:Leucine-rich repeat (LRR) protein